MKSKKFIIISAIAVVVFSLIIGAIYFDAHYAVIDKKIYKNDIKYLHILSLDASEIKEVNKCTEIEEMFLAESGDDLVSKFRNFKNLNTLHLVCSIISSLDFEKISVFNNLKKVTSYMSNIDFNGFCNKNVMSILLYESIIQNLESLVECKSLKSLTIWDSAVSDNSIIIEDRKYIMKDSSVFASLDNLTFLAVIVDKIEDISGIIEMDSLNKFCVMEDSLSETDKKLLEDKGISVIENTQ